jgi:hypothetical protein
LQEQLQKTIEALPEFIRSRWPMLNASNLTHSQALLIAALLHAHRPPTSTDEIPEAARVVTTWDDLAASLGRPVSGQPPPSLEEEERQRVWEAQIVEGVSETALLRCIGCNKIVAAAVVSQHESSCVEQQRMRAATREDLKRKRQEEPPPKRARQRLNEPRPDPAPTTNTRHAAPPPEEAPTLSSVLVALGAATHPNPNLESALTLIAEAISSHKVDHFNNPRAPEHMEADAMKRSGLKLPPNHSFPNVNPLPKHFHRRSAMHTSHPYPATELPPGVRSYTGQLPPPPGSASSALTPQTQQNVVHVRPPQQPRPPGPPTPQQGQVQAQQ